MKKIFSITGLLLLCMALMVPALTSCSDDNDEFDTNQFKGGVNLNAFGPSPVARGGQLRFIGSGMDQILKVSIPGCDDITDIERISSQEIRVTVPQTAEPGHVVLHYANGTITTKSTLSYTEPIGIEDITPSRVKPGETLTIKGEYLNLIKEVCFSFVADSVNVFAPDFITHDRKEISLIVPEEAVSGIIIISDAKAMPNAIKSEQEIDVVLPSVDATLDLTGAKGGQTVTVKGHDFDLVDKVQMPNGSDVDFTYDSEQGAITFVLPDNVTDGAIVVITKSLVSVAIANIGTAIPDKLVVEPATEIRAGQTIKIKGINMEQVVDVTLAGDPDNVALTAQSATEIEFVFTDKAQSGNAILNLKSGKTVEVELSTAKPEVVSFNPESVAAAAEFTMRGRNLDLVVSVVFQGGVTVDVENAAADAITMIAPATAESGALTLNMANGESVVTAPLTIVAPECANITSVLTEDLVAGNLMEAIVANGDKLTGVEVNGQAVQYILNNDHLYINLPESCGAGTKVRLISSNGEITYTYDVTPATHVEKVIFTEVRDLGSWAGEGDGGAFRLYKESFDGVPAGAKLVFHIVTTGDNPQLQMNDANWGQMEMLQPGAGATQAVFELTAEYLNRILTTDDGWSTTAMVIQGQQAIVNKVALEWENSLETTIWEGEWSSAGWAGNQDLAWGGFDWSTVKAGSILRLYCTPLVADGEWWCISLRHGNGWGNLPDPIAGQYDTPAGNVLEVALPQNVLDDIIAEGGLVITGDGYVLNKVTIE